MMLKPVKNFIRKIVKRSGWELVKRSVLEDMLHGIPTDYKPSHADTYNKVKDHTMMTSQRVVAICNAVDYLTENNIEGDIVACGVWRGGAVMTAIDTLKKANSTSRDIYVYDTFEGMTTPGHEYDLKTGGNSGVGKTAEELYKNATASDLVFCYSAIDEVKQNIEQFGYPRQKVHYIKGMVEDTIPATLPKKIAFLYFSISFYKSVLHTLEHLYPLIASGGVILISDYGDWEGTKKAVDEYIENNKVKLLLNRIDQTGRIGVKS
jgi:O-methyltransferase